MYFFFNKEGRYVMEGSNSCGCHDRSTMFTSRPCGLGPACVTCKLWMVDQFWVNIPILEWVLNYDIHEYHHDNCISLHNQAIFLRIFCVSRVISQLIVPVSREWAKSLGRMERGSSGIFKPCFWQVQRSVSQAYCHTTLFWWAELVPWYLCRSLVNTCQPRGASQL